MARILLILVAIAAINAAAWGTNYLHAATVRRQGQWSPAARTSMRMGLKASKIVLKPFFWIGGNSPSMFAIGGVILLETTIIEFPLRLYEIGRNEKEE